MKKFYLSALALLFFLFGGYAQPFTGGTYSTVAAGGLASVAGTWTNSVGPGTDCYNCQIIINGPVIGDQPQVFINGGQLLITSGSSLEIDQYFQLFDVEVIVEDNASIFVNDEVDLNGSTTIRLANTGSFINANNDNGNPISGTGTPANDLGISGLFYVTGTTGAPPVITTYDVALSSLGMGSSTGAGSFPQYNINCGGASPNICSFGIVYGPAVTTNPGPHGIYEFIQAAPLPVTLVQLAASRNADQTINVSWATSQEVNASYFGVERSGDAANWQTLGTVKAKGFSTITTNYSYKDASPLGGANYYRLKMVDLDGKFQYSKVVSVSSDAKTESLVIYNNPYSDMIRLKLNMHSTDNLTLTLTDMLGKVYSSQNYIAKAGDNFINIIPSAQPAGMYVLHIQGNSYDKTVKLVKQ